MQIVIDIPEEIYNSARAVNKMLYDVWDMRMTGFVCAAIANGTPLPKGHGDLIDRKELLKQPIDMANYPSNYVKIAPPIIEAESEV